jgi:hypothetical protein
MSPGHYPEVSEGVTLFSGSEHHFNSFMSRKILPENPVLLFPVFLAGRKCLIDLFPNVKIR